MHGIWYVFDYNVNTYLVLFYFSAMRSVGSTLGGMGDYFNTGAATTSDANPARTAPAPQPAAPQAAAHPVRVPASSRPGCGGTQTLIAEVLWAMKCVESHYSFRSCEGTSDSFKRMFQGHHVAETKCRYLCQFGLAPHFSSLLKSRINKDSEYVLLFDESMNTKTKNKQLDIHVRLWHHDQVHTRYLTSQFIGHAAATDLLEHFHASTSNLRRSGLLQVSMDGPSVNWSFYDKLGKEIKDECDMGLMNIGSCGLHVIHGAFQTGARETGWDLGDILSSPYNLFKDTSARRDDFTDVTGCKDFPLKFCNHRWVENGPVCSRVILLWPHLKLFVEACESKKKPKPTSNSYKTLHGAMNDKLSVAKLSFFRSVASAVEPFLALYQTDKPMGPFLVHDIERLVRNLLERCVKPVALQNASTAYDLLKLDLEKERVENKKIEVGFKAESELKSLLRTKAISERQVFQFKEECRLFVVKCVNKIFERSPLKYSLARNMASLDPRLMVTDQEHSKSKFKCLLENLVTLNRVDGDNVDMLVASYKELLQDVAGCELKSRFKDFKVEDDRVDVLL